MAKEKYKKYYLFNVSKDILSWIQLPNYIGAFDTVQDIIAKVDSWNVFYNDKFLIVGLTKTLELVPLYWAVPEHTNHKFNGKFYTRVEIVNWHDTQKELEEKRKRDLEDDEEE